MDWISIEDRLPDFEEKVIVCEANNIDSTEICRLNTVTNWSGGSSYEWLIGDTYEVYWNDVTHWMPLPKTKTT